MINFKQDFTAFIDGEERDLSSLPSRSVKDIFTASRMINEYPPMADKSIQLRVLSDEVIARLFIRQFVIYGKDVLSGNPSWVTYNEAFLFYVYFFIKRHRCLLKEWGVSLSNPIYREIEVNLRMSALGGVVTYEGKEYTSNEVISLKPMNWSAYTKVRGNGPGHRSLIPILDDKTSLLKAKDIASKVYYDENKIYALPYLTMEIARRIEEVEYGVKTETFDESEVRFRFD